MDCDRILDFPDVCQKTGIYNLIYGALIVKKHIVLIDHSPGTALEKFVLSFVEVLYLLHRNVRVHLLRFTPALYGPSCHTCSIQCLPSPVWANIVASSLVPSPASCLRWLTFHPDGGWYVFKMHSIRALRVLACSGYVVFSHAAVTILLTYMS